MTSTTVYYVQVINDVHILDMTIDSQLTLFDLLVGLSLMRMKGGAINNYADQKNVTMCGDRC